MNSTIYVAIHNETRQIVSGAKGQAAFFDIISLRRSIGQTGLPFIAKEKGVKSKDLYTIIELDISQDIEDFLPKGCDVDNA